MPIDQIYASLTAEQRDELYILDDPCRWAEATLRNPLSPKDPLILRPYQREMIRFQPKMVKDHNGNEYLGQRIKAYRLGRRSGKSIILMVEAIYHAFVNTNYKVLILAPFEAQIMDLFNKIHDLIKDTFIVPVRDVRKPFVIEFANGSQIRGFTAGAKSAAKGTGIRGQESDLTVIDEADYGIDDVINDVVMPIFYGNHRSRLIFSSTPTGRHGLFWEMCTKEEKYGSKEFYVPSTHIPGWTDRDTQGARLSSKTQVRFDHEYMALFGDQEEGVFLNQHIVFCLKDYLTKDQSELGLSPYDVLEYNPKNHYYMGVDWNENYGVTINIIEKHPKSDKVRLWRKIRVERGEFTQPEAVDQIIEWSEKMKFRAIYVDHGFGFAQDQWLRRHGVETPGSNLNEIVKAIDYGGNIEIKDVVTKEIIKKPAKPFMVDNAVYFVEHHLLDLPKEEDEKERLVGAMRGYKIKKFAAGSNDPVYTCDEPDHELDAMFLSLLAVTMDTTDLNVPNAPSLPSQSIAPFINGSASREIDFNDRAAKSDKINRAIAVALPNFKREIIRTDGYNKTGSTLKRSRLAPPKRANI